jgi:hypothetical protein
MFPFGVTIKATVPQGSEIPEGLMNNPVLGITGARAKSRKVSGSIPDGVIGGFH